MLFYALSAGVGLFYALANLYMCRRLKLHEWLLFMEGRIPARGEILYLEDYLFFRWGDRVYVTVLDFCVAVVLVTGHWSWVAALVVIILGTVWTWFCHAKLWLPRKTAFDSCYPRTGYMSPLGRVHLIYFWFQWTFGLLGLWEAAQMAPRALGLSFGRPLDWHTSPVALLGLAAAGAYFWTLRLDAKAGRFPTH